MDVPQGRFELALRHANPRSSLRAWDAADEYLLREVRERDLPTPTLVVGDRAGALTCALHHYGIVWLGDSEVARITMRDNLASNGLDPERVTVVQMPTLPPAGPASAIVKIPKSLDHLEATLHLVRRVLPGGAPVLGAGMAKYLPASVREMFGRIIGPTDQSLAWKKARVLSSVVDPDLDPGPPPEPVTLELPGGEQVVGLPGVFGAAGLDGGTRLLLEHIPTDVGVGKIIDLGCGTGVVGVVAMTRNPEATVIFRDDQPSAVESARRSVAATFGAQTLEAGGRAEFEVADGLDGIAHDSVDLVLLNPPFHDGHAISTDIAWRLIRDARRVLAKGGRLIVVANRHLDHHTTMQRTFSNAAVLGSDRRFVVLQSQQR